jgi:hypothetical protein
MFPGEPSTETWLHRKFGGHRIKGDLYERNDAILNFAAMVGTPDAWIVRRAEHSCRKTDTPKNPIGQAMVAMRNTKLTAEQRSAIAKKAAAARWGKKDDAK